MDTPTSSTEFIVSGIVEGSSGFLHVIGRCGDKQINVGDVFESIYHYEYSSEPSGREIAKPVVDSRVRLVVEMASAYGRELPFLGEGMTGRLSLVDEGRELVRPECILGVANPIELWADPISEPHKIDI